MSSPPLLSLAAGALGLESGVLSTPALLDSFRVTPEKGALSFPVVHAPEEGTFHQPPTLSLADLSQGTFADYHQTSSLLFHEAARMVLEAQGQIPLPLTSTEGEWSIDKFIASSGMVEFLSSHGTRVALAEDFLMVGSECSCITQSMALYLQPSDGKSRTEYEFTFREEGVARLRAALGYTRQSLVDVAFKMAALILTSGQFTDQGTQNMKISSRGREFRLHQDAQGHVTFHGKRPEEVRRFDEKFILYTDPKNIPWETCAAFEPPFVIHASTEASRGEVFRVLISSKYREDTLPLTSRAKEVLWDLSAMLMFSGITGI